MFTRKLKDYEDDEKNEFQKKPLYERLTGRTYVDKKKKKKSKNEKN